MRYLIIAGMAAAIFGLTACSESGGEDEPFFSSPLSRTLFNQCRPANSKTPRTPENEQPFTIFNSSFGRDRITETGAANQGVFFINCLSNPPEAATITPSDTVLPSLTQ